MAKEKMMMIQGVDRQHKEFTAFVLCNNEQGRALEKATERGAGPLNLEELNIIYTVAGHNIDEKVLHDIQEYYQHIIGEVD